MKNFFEKISREEVESLFKKGIFEKCQLTYTELTTQKATIKIQLATDSNEKFGRVFVLPNQVAELKDKICAFSFRVGSRLFFFKEQVKIGNKGFYVDVDFNILELKRRRHVRFDLLEEYEHHCYLTSVQTSDLKMNCKVINISESGVRVKVESDLIIFQKTQEVSVHLRVGKRAPFAVQALIRFVARKSKENPELGLEFIQMNDIRLSRILSICEDLSRLQLQNQRLKKSL